MIRQYELVEKVKSYDPKADSDLINRAYIFSMKAHGDQRRASGDPYFTHPLEVANILADMRLDTASVVTALLHDTVEDTKVTIAEIRELFGSEIADLVNGVTKLSQIEIQSGKSQQAENFRKLVLAMSNDIRVLLVKLADRLHNMRTLHHVREEKRKRIARETLDIYAPLAERIGIITIKDELEDLAFKTLNPDAYDSITARLEYLQGRDSSPQSQSQKNSIDFVIKELEKIISREGVVAKIAGRIKRPYSIWRKMKFKNISIEQLLDIVAFRIIVSSIEECYRILGILHHQFRVIPDRFKDYISTPKPNGYQSLHTGIIGPEGNRIEIQIRTEEMHRIAELGVAAHWDYKQNQDPNHAKQKQQDKNDYSWLRSLLEILEHASGAEEFLEHTKLEMFSDQVFCFTPGGDLISLPNGATPVDFAYAIHSEVGNHCMAAKVNGRMVPFRTILKNGDQVEITTAKSQHPSPSWERFVVTGKARACIRKFIRGQKKEQFATLGKSILNTAFDNAGLDYTEKQLSDALDKYSCDTTQDLYALVGEGLAASSDIIRTLYPNYTYKIKTATEELSMQGVGQHRSVKKRIQMNDRALSIKGLIPGMAVHYAGCCHPLPGDRVVGIIMSGRGITVHTYDCDMLKNFANEPERWIDVTWTNIQDENPHIGRLRVLLENSQGALAKMTNIVSRGNSNIVNLKVTNRSREFFEMQLDLEVVNSQQLSELIANLRTSAQVITVERI